MTKVDVIGDPSYEEEEEALPPVGSFSGPLAVSFVGTVALLPVGPPEAGDASLEEEEALPTVGSLSESCAESFVGTAGAALLPAKSPSVTPPVASFSEGSVIAATLVVVLLELVGLIGVKCSQHKEQVGTCRRSKMAS